jgi:hypothetical protein
LLVALEEGLRDRDPLLAFLALVLGLAFFALEFFALVRVLAAVLAARRRAGFSGFVSAATADIATDCPGLRPSPMVLAN